MRRLLLAGSGLILLGPLTTVQSLACDSTVVTEQTDPWRYKARDGRCEGRFLAPMTAPSVRIVGYYLGSPWAGDPPETPLRITWPKAPSPVRLRAVSLRWRTFYRMDALAQATPFSWPTTIVRTLSFTGKDLGVLASYTVRDGPGNHQALLPVSVNGEHVPDRKVFVTLLLEPDFDLDRVTLDATVVGQQARIQVPALTGTFVGRRPVSLRLSDVRPGLYQVLIVAQGGKKVASAEALLLIPGR